MCLVTVVQASPPVKLEGKESPSQSAVGETTDSDQVLYVDASSVTSVAEDCANSSHYG